MEDLEESEIEQSSNSRLRLLQYIGTQSIGTNETRQTNNAANKLKNIVAVSGLIMTVICLCTASIQMYNLNRQVHQTMSLYLSYQHNMESVLDSVSKLILELGEYILMEVRNIKQEMRSSLNKYESYNQDPVYRTNIKPIEIDYAAEHMGGIVEKVTNVFYGSNMFLNFFKNPVTYANKNDYNVILRTSFNPYQCLDLKGQTGNITIKLSTPIKIKNIIVYHISNKDTNSTLSAPKHINVYGILNKENETKQIGQFEYEINKNIGQNFFTKKSIDLFSHVIIEVLNNHGNEKYTKICQIKVIGKE